jgi:general stress protein YciG
MTKQGLRIYVYKITFYGVPHYYFGVHKEKFFDEYYVGSPVTHKDFWELYIPKKEYIEFFEYSDEGYTEARIFENSLIAPVLNDEFCLNEHCGGSLSLEACRKGGKKGGNKTKENKTGIFDLSPEEISEKCKKGGKISGNKSKENKTGIFDLSPEEMSENRKKGGKISGNKHKENKTGVCGRSLEKMSEDGKITSAQKWQCTETGHVSNVGGLTRYQKAKGIDTSKRIKVDGPREWEITFKDGRVVVITIPLKTWARENGYNYQCLIGVRGGKVKNHKSIIKVFPL